MRKWFGPNEKMANMKIQFSRLESASKSDRGANCIASHTKLCNFVCN